MFAHKPFASVQHIDLKGSAGFDFRELGELSENRRRQRILSGTLHAQRSINSAENASLPEQ
jgi:hypothetical protein